MDYYVYVHRRLSDNLPFYVGKGRKERAFKFSGRNSHWQRVKEKHGVKVEIVFDNLSEEEAFRCEIDTILEFEYFGYPLTNQTKGGEGQSGRNLTDSQKKHLSDVHKGRIKDAEWCKNLSLALKGKKKTPEAIKAASLPRRGKKRNPDATAKMIQTFKKIKHKHDLNEYVFFTNDDIFVGTRRSLAEHIGIDHNKLRTLFQTNSNKTCYGWSVLTLKNLILFKELYVCIIY